MQGEYTIKEAIPLLHKSETTIRKLCGTGLVEGTHKYGKFWYLSKAAILKINPKAFDNLQLSEHEAPAHKDFSDHYREMAQMANIIAGRLKVLLGFSSYKQHIDMSGDIIKGIYFCYLETKQSVEGGLDKKLIEPIDVLRASDLLEHFNQQFPEVHFIKWQDYKMENVNQGVIDKLNLLVRTKAFHPCDKCEACNLILTT